MLTYARLHSPRDQTLIHVDVRFSSLHGGHAQLANCQPCLLFTTLTINLAVVGS
jgi:hypothetical protein